MRAIQAAAEQRRKAMKTRGLSAPDSVADFFCIHLGSGVSEVANLRTWVLLRLLYWEEFRLSRTICDRSSHIVSLNERDAGRVVLSANDRRIGGWSERPDDR